MKEKEKEVRVLDKHGNYLSQCTKKRANQLIRRRMAKWVDWNVLQLLYDREDKKRFREEALARDNYTCYICGKKMYPGHPELSVDHIIPMVKGGSDLPDNLACCCKTCNEAKGNMTLSEFLQLRQKETG